MTGFDLSGWLLAAAILATGLVVLWHLAGWRADAAGWQFAYARAPYLFREMMSQLGVDLQRLGGGRALALFGQATRRCAYCTSRDECRHWLSEGGDPQAYRSFCPAAKMLDGLPRG